MAVDLTQKYGKQIAKARINAPIALKISENVKNPAELFPVIDRVFMKAKFSGLTTDQIVAILVSGAFANETVDEHKLIVLKPYLALWPDSPLTAQLALKAGLSPEEIKKMGPENISLDSLKVMASLG